MIDFSFSKDEGIGEQAGVQISLRGREMAESTASPSQHPRVSGSFLVLLFSLLENVIRFCFGQGAELMGKYGVNVPKGVAVSSLDQVKNAIDQVFPNESEVLCFPKRELF